MSCPGSSGHYTSEDGDNFEHGVCQACGEPISWNEDEDRWDLASDPMEWAYVPLEDVRPDDRVIYVYVQRGGQRVVNEVEHERQQEEAWLGQTMAEHLQALLDERDAEDFARLNRDLYKYTVCGAYLGITLWGGEPVWSDDKRLPTLRPGDIQGIGVGTIVEGTDSEPEMEWLNLLTYAEDEDASRLIKDFDVAVQHIEDAARDIWNETHGCQDCWQNHRVDDSVDPNCDTCGGKGVVI